MPQLECVCGARSASVSIPPSPAEERLLAGFRRLHDNCPWRLVTAKQPCGPFGTPKAPPRAVPGGAHGYFEATGPYGESQRGETVSCCHCRKHVEYRADVPAKLGWCGKCAAPTCGGPLCAAACIPYEQRLTNVEAGLAALTPAPAAVTVPNLLDPSEN